MKNPLTPAGKEPATYTFVAQHLKHCAAKFNKVFSGLQPRRVVEWLLK